MFPKTMESLQSTNPPSLSSVFPSNCSQLGKMAPWVHCNKCIAQYSPNTAIFILECGHLLCGKCCNQGDNQQCPICNRNVNCIKLGDQMADSVKNFFVPIQQHLRKMTEKLTAMTSACKTDARTVFQIYQFQQNHNRTYINSIIAKQNALKRQYSEVCKENAKLAAEIHRMQCLLRNQHQGMGANISTSTPTPRLTMRPTAHPFINPNHTMISSIQRGSIQRHGGTRRMNEMRSASGSSAMTHRPPPPMTHRGPPSMTHRPPPPSIYSRRSSEAQRPLQINPQGPFRVPGPNIYISILNNPGFDARILPKSTAIS